MCSTKLTLQPLASCLTRFRVWLVQRAVYDMYIYSRILHAYSSDQLLLFILLEIK